MAPIILLLILFSAFGLVIYSLGIYQDDWVFVYNAYARGHQGLWDFLNADGTPFSSFMNIALFDILGIKPLYWHLSALIARWLTVVAFWLLFRRLWPGNPIENLLASMLFAVYPFFNLQALAFTYLHIWVAYAFLGLSLYWMVLSVQALERFWLFFSLSLIAGIVTGITLEYFMGLELLRPIILWLALRDQEDDARRRWRRALKLWLPYLISFGIYVWWRFFIFQLPIETRNDPVGLKMLLSEPLAEISVILSNILPDILSIVVTAWYRVLDPAFFNLTDRRNLLFILLSVAAGAGTFLALRYYGQNEPESDQANQGWPREALWLGFFIVVLGLIPPYIAGLFINEKNPLWNSRLGLASMLGASLMVAALVELISPRLRTRLLLVAILVGLAVGYHARYTNDFRWAWRKETNLFRQLILRVPALQPNTAIVAEGEILYYMGDYPTAYAINSIYAKPLGDRDLYVDYWFYGIITNFGKNKDAFLDGMELDAFHRSTSFRGRSDQSLIISFEPEADECLHVIRPRDAALRAFSPLLREASRLSALDRINTSAASSSAFLQAVGLQSQTDWCTYYQKADLARQNADFGKVITLWQDARKNGFSPGNYFEYIPFVEALVQEDRWDEAAYLTLEASHNFPIGRPTMCDYWYSLPETAQRDSVLGKLEPKLGCFTK